jgi:hypothetical protein
VRASKDVVDKLVEAIQPEAACDTALNIAGKSEISAE